MCLRDTDSGARVINSTTFSGGLRSIPSSVLSRLIVVFTFREDPVETVCRVKSGFQKARSTGSGG